MKLKDKEKIVRALENKKKFLVSLSESIYYEKEIYASSEEEAKQKYWDGEFEFEEKDIADVEVLDGSLLIEEVKE